MIGIAVLLGTIGSAAPSAQAAPRQVPANPQEAAPAAPAAEELVNLPKTESWLGTVRIPTRVMADGAPLAAGTYRVRLTTETAEPRATGALATLERWVEFVQGNEVKGRALAPVIPAPAVEEVAEGRPPARGRFKVERLKEDEYLRLWFNTGGDQVLIHLPLAR